MDYSLVLVEWEDSSSPRDGGWKFTDELPQLTPLTVLSCGFIVQEDEEQINLAGHLAFPTALDDEQVTGLMQIPRRCIINITYFNQLDEVLPQQE